MPQANVILPAPNGLDDPELMQLAIYKLNQLGTIEGGEIGVFIADRPEDTPAECPKDTVFFEFRASVIPILGRK